MPHHEFNLYPDLWNQRFQCLVTMCMGQLYGISWFTHFNISWTRNRELQGRTCLLLYRKLILWNINKMTVWQEFGRQLDQIFAGVISSFITQHPCLRQTTRDRTSECNHCPTPGASYFVSDLRWFPRGPFQQKSQTYGMPVWAFLCDKRKMPIAIQGQRSRSYYHLEKPYKQELLDTDWTIEVKTINTFF